MRGDDRPCVSYRPGHTLHPIQVSQANRDVGYPGVAVAVVAVDDDGRVRLRDPSGAEHVRFTHDPARLATVSSEGGAVRWQDAWSLLRVWAVPDDGRQVVFSLGREAEGGPGGCLREEEPEESEEAASLEEFARRMVEQVEKYGGFLGRPPGGTV